MDSTEQYYRRTLWLERLVKAWMAALGLRSLGAAGMLSHLGKQAPSVQDIGFGSMAALVYGLGVFAMALMFMASAALFLRVLYRSHANARAFRAPPAFCGPVAAVAYWFIPIANLVLGLLVVRSIFRSSAAQAGHADDSAGLLTGWWLAWLTGNLFALLGGVATPTGQTPAALATLAEGSLFASVLQLGAGILFLLVIRKLKDVHLDALRQTGGESSGNFGFSATIEA
ncbi:MAG: DUF4328 domain-containing protein [Gammaproteobacteria bacterium]|jgi:hypothetical protein